MKRPDRDPALELGLLLIVVGLIGVCVVLAIVR
jgi:hypothetical protein